MDRGINTPAALYASGFVEESLDVKYFLWGTYFDHVPEVDRDGDYSSNTRVRVRVHAHYDHDYRRFARLASVWVDGAPVMVIQNGGREGDDHHMRFVTDLGGYRDLVSYLRSINSLEIPDEVISPDQEVDGLTYFYDTNLLGLIPNLE